VAKAKAVVHKVVRVVKKAVARVVSKAKAVVHSVARAVSKAVTHIRDAARDVYHAARHVYRAATRVVRSAYHAVAKATKAAVHYVAKHAAAVVNKVKKEYDAHKSDIEGALKVVSKVAGKVAVVASIVAAAAPVLDVIAAVTAEVPVLDVVTAGLAATADAAGEVAELANEVSMEAGSVADAMAGDWEGALGDAAMGSLGGEGDMLDEGEGEAAAAVDDDAGSVVGGGGESAGEDAKDSGGGTTSGHTTENARQSSADGKAEGGGGGASCKANSFTAGQKVMLAGGTSMAISQVKVGDIVENAVPGTNITQQHRVDAVIVTYTDHDFVNVNVTVTAVTQAAVKQGATAASAGKGQHKAAAKTASGTSPPAKDGQKNAKSTTPSPAEKAETSMSAKTSTIQTTFYHPFYDETTHAFVDADDLKVGDRLQSTAGTTVIVSALRQYHANTITYDLTIGQLHTFYVLTGSTPVLVHNCDSVVLGVNPQSDELAASLNANGDAAAHTFNGDAYAGVEAGAPKWMTGVLKSVGDSNTRLSITLDGMPGAGSTPESVQSAFMAAAERGQGFGLGEGQTLPGPGYGTAWEMSVVARNVRAWNAGIEDGEDYGGRAWSSIDWYSGNQLIPNVPEPPEL
jgi:hypothetical protein